MSHRKTLTQLFWFKVAFCAPLAVGAIVAAIIICNDPYFSGNVCLTSECLNEAVNRLKIPITISAIIFPAVALVASYHRSVQTAAQIARTDKQIVATEAKNAFENCIKHRELFDLLINKLAERYEVTFKNHDLLYKKIFNKNDYSRFSNIADEMKENLLDRDRNYFDFIKCHLNSIKYTDEGPFLYENILSDIFRFISIFLHIDGYHSVKINSADFVEKFFFDQNGGVYQEKIDSFLDDFNNILDEILSFSLSYELYSDFKREKVFYISPQLFHEVLADLDDRYFIQP